MKKALNIIIFLAFFVMLGVSFADKEKRPIQGGPIDHENLTDGVYEGSYRAGPNKAAVRVTIENKKLVQIEIIKHRAWKGKKAESIISNRILESQSTKVDAVTGATNSSRVIMNAVQNAIEKAYQR